MDLKPKTLAEAKAESALALRARRRLLATGGAGLGLGWMGLAGLAGLPLRLHAAPADLRDAPELQRMLARMAAGGPLQPGGVRLDLPALVENGNAVPVTVEAEGPVTGPDRVATLALFTARNPQPEVAEFRLGPRSGRARVGTRIRLATSQQVMAVARHADGRVRYTTVDVLVTLAACIE